MAIRLIIAVLSLSMCFVIPLFFNDLLEFFVTKLGSGWVFSTLFIRLLVVIMLTICLREIFSLWKKSRKIKVWIIFLIALLPGIGISMLHPVYVGDYGTPAANTEEIELDITELSQATGNEFELGEGNHIIAFFTSTCPHCKATSNKLGINVEAGQKVPVTVFFPSLREDADRFLNENRGTKFDSYCISDQVFTNNAGNSFPITFLVDKDGKTLNYWRGDVISYNVLDDLLDME
ncbi:MAG: hypothetical protein MI810_13275 [Flavobacteriales bacterium]|nr:hypothetical protein [Flavobacteriales bacterium]